MNTATTWQTNSTSSEQTEQLGQRLGKALKGGEVIELASDLGGGKTTFVRGLARGAGSTDKVSSPTFTISKVYRAGSFHIHHFDFYRLGEAGIIGDELAEEMGSPGNIVVVEWANVVEHMLPYDRLTITFEQTTEGHRRLTFSCPVSLQYLLEAVK
ncbi:MAG TPA: tRNA (adenosine(37)-N6)-threonylcarbamoyltransferase complex ATPase subunit type 1 TsaE [Nevskiaceae bacterium]|nr:tRNA (adenosine(37)-N6)-threonylcarbamoyltransferase complex ATPase subunit type 1 TsaE [Nevskiaceae bacterium]